MAAEDDALNGDIGRRADVHGAQLAWRPSPSPTVTRKRLHRTGGAEDGQVTSIVRYAPGASFPAHDHPEGEEILVLEGTFSDEHGDWPAGTFLANPEGFRHAPFSREGCVLFVKLRQLAGPGRQHVALQTGDMRWEPTGTPGVAAKPLLADAAFPDQTRLERWDAGTDRGPRHYPRGAEFFVWKGSFEDEAGRHAAHAWLRLPPGGAHHARSPEGCIVYVKTGAVAALRCG